METCSNCGATLRPGAKFCTTCGTRLNPTSTANDGWGGPVEQPADPTQETAVLEAVKPPTPQQPTRLAGHNQQREYDRWTAAYGDTSATANDPASRFISALEQDARPAESEAPVEEQTEPEEDAPKPATTWVTPPPEAFGTGRPSTWNFQASSQDDDTWKAPSTWNTVGPAPEETEVERTNDPAVVLNPILPSNEAEKGAAQEPDINALPEVAERTDDAATDAATVIDVQPAAVVEAASQDAEEDEADLAEVLAAGPAATTPDEDLSPQDARARAISLVDDLRRVIRTMPGGNPPDMGAAAMALTEASLNVSDFGDVREAITELQEDPRDIQALSNLARMADKIELLLDEHQALATAIETALQEMSGQY